jgi:hypothetical protein
MSDLDNISGYLFKELEKTLLYDCHTLGYKYCIREYISLSKLNITESDTSSTNAGAGANAGDNAGLTNIIFKCANSCFKYYTQNEHIFKTDKSLHAITQLCNTPDFWYNVNKEDKNVSFFSKLFNIKISSSRKLFHCYDCGTMARAFFFALIKANRGNITLSPDEVAIMKRMYYSVDVSVIERMADCLACIKAINKETIFICSIGLNLSGHVFVIEKRIMPGNKERYHIYQTCLNAYNILDYIEHHDLAKNINMSININDFFSKLIHIFQCAEWGYPEKLIFAKLFAFIPDHDINNHSEKYSFCWTYITY